MKIKQMQILKKEFKGKNYVITSEKEKNIKIDIPAGINFLVESTKIFETFMQIKASLAPYEKVEVVITQSNRREFTLGGLPEIFQ